MKPNRVKQMLAEGKYTCGSWVSMCSPVAAEVMGLVGFQGSSFPSVLPLAKTAAAKLNNINTMMILFNISDSFR